MTSSAKKQGRLLAIIGTDTEIGKTVIAAALARSFRRAGLDVGVFKPFASDPALTAQGRPLSTDADLLVRGAGLDAPPESAVGQHFTAPLSPQASARLEGASVRPAAVLKRIRALAPRHDLTLVEGCGGWEVPLTSRQTTAHFFTRLGAPVLVVARSNLGTINHSLLTLNAVRAAGLPVVGIILNRVAPSAADPSEQFNADDLRAFARVPVWGPIPHRPSLAGKTGNQIPTSHLPSLDSHTPAILRRLKRMH